MSVYAAYAFNEGSGLSIIDYSGKGRNMTIAGTNSWVTGKIYTNAFQSGAAAGDGAQWDGGTTLAALSGDVTLQVWYQHTGGSGTTTCHAGGLYSSSGTARLAAYSYRSLVGVAGSPEITVRDSAGTIISIADTSNTADGNWHNAALVYHSTGLMEEYLDGTLVSSSSPTSNPIGTTVRFIGVGYLLSGAFAQANVQDMRVFDSALTAQDVSTYMNTPVVMVSSLPNLMMSAFP